MTLVDPPEQAAQAPQLAGDRFPALGHEPFNLTDAELDQEWEQAGL